MEYITPGLLDHYAGESYLNQPHLNIAYSNSSSWTLHRLIVTTLVVSYLIFVYFYHLLWLKYERNSQISFDF